MASPAYAHNREKERVASSMTKLLNIASWWYLTRICVFFFILKGFGWPAVALVCSGVLTEPRTPPRTKCHLTHYLLLIVLTQYLCVSRWV